MVGVVQDLLIDESEEMVALGLSSLANLVDGGEMEFGPSFKAVKKLVGLEVHESKSHGAQTEAVKLGFCFLHVSFMNLW